MLVALTALDLRIPLAGSLKEKRRVVRTIKDGLRQKFNVSVAEVGHHDLRQRVTLGVSAVGAEGYHLKKVMHEVERFVERRPEVEILSRHVTIHSQDD